MASKLLLNALKAKIVSNPFASAPASQQQDDPVVGQVVGDFHLTPAAGTDPAAQAGTQSSGQAAADPVPAVSPSVLAPAESLDLKALAPAPEPGLAVPVLASPEPTEAAPALAVPEGTLTPQEIKSAPQVTAAGPALESVPTSDAVVFPQLTLETDREAEDLAAKVKALEGQKRKLTFKRFLPRAAGFAVLVLMGLSASALSGPSSVPGATTQASVVDPSPANGADSTAGGPEQITAMRYFIEVARVCTMEPPVRTKLQQQLREETNGLTVNEAIAYWVFACGHPLEAYVDRGFGPWATEHGIVTKDDEVSQPLTRSVMQKIFSAKVS